MQRTAALLQAKDSGKEAAISIELHRIPQPGGRPIRNPLPSVAISHEPTAAPAPRAGRGAAAQSEKRRRTNGVEEVGMCYNMANEPWQTYAYPFLMDTGFMRTDRASAKFEDHVLYLESTRCAAASCA